ncbi:MAG: MaoC family dehydratase [Betaproteobacteria bacterium]|nr:MaoC family dehydratase [Betaproteobacteria bacterium]
MNRTVATTVGAEPVSEMAIRRYVEAHELNCPVFSDVEAGRAAGHGGIIAPWSMLLTMAMPAYWKPGDPPLKPGFIPPFVWDCVPLPGSEMVTYSVEVEYFVPLRVDDVVHSEYRVKSITPKRTRVGVGHFIEFQINFTDQNGRLIAKETTNIFRYTPDDETSGGGQ